MADMYIKLSDLERVKSALEDIIDDFENATSLSEELENAISDPFGRSKLRDKARDFEERWDDKRHELTLSLKDVKDHVQGVLDGVEEWDAETAGQLSSAGGGGGSGSW